MILTLGDVISLATTFAGRSDFSSSEVSRLANMALTEVSNRVYHKSKEVEAISNLTGAGNERRVALPADFDGVVNLTLFSTSTTTLGVNVLGDEVELFPVSVSLIDSLSSTSGTPSRYIVYGGFIELDPIPNSRGSLLMRYLAKQATLLATGESPDLDERWHAGWLNKTEEYVHRARSNHAGAADAERRYVNYMISTPNDRAIEQMDKLMGLWVKRSS